MVGGRKEPVAMSGSRSQHELVLLDQADSALSQARSLEEIKIIRNKAEAVRKYAESASLGLQVQNRAAEVKLRAERQAGQLLSQMMLRGGDRRSKGHRDRLKLNDLGLTPNQSKRWQMQARVPEEVFLQHVQETSEEGKELTSAGLMRLAKRLQGTCPSPRDSHRKAMRRGVQRSAGPIGALGFRKSRVEGDRAAIVDELLNHHRLLDGILSPVYSGESSALKAAETRMLRYLIAEIGKLLGELEERDRSPLGHHRHARREVS